jgi:hypothetical protein
MSETRRFSLFPKPLKGCIEPITRPLFREQAGATARLLTHWPEIVGEKLASRCHPQQLSKRGGQKKGCTLQLAVENGFATEIQYMSAMILERIQTCLGDASVDQIVISHTYTRAAAAPAKKTRPKMTAPLHTDLPVEDPELAAALRSLARTLSSEPA